MGETRSGPTLGVLLDRERVRAGVTLRGLNQATGIPLTSLHRLFHDQVSRPDPAHLALIADTLGAPRAPLFAAAGYPAPAHSLDSALRAAYTLPEAAYARIHAAIADVVAQYPQPTGQGA